ncbi:oxidoreductase [Intrasporangium chromatireducens Q5-1]|uniref:Oxidoreductase n=1 Tax=Intrasporangium chromatireducens Q5-1 TaxID=584657 RepID=W9GNC7_9MICO|nr:LLM class flavin-dependent oxidoreductase [Intrasporangium chromatireducens]EWT07776.1 oxidoreductase [Intrasporangium chromatireducens Q5-1]
MTKVGISFPHDALMASGPDQRRRLLHHTTRAGLDHVTVGDHISFHGGTGFDGIVSASSVLATQDDVSVLIGVYLLGLRHPMVAARQLATLAEMAPGRLVLGVGVGGEDRSEISNSGVDPATRGRQLDEALGLVRRLLTGDEVTHAGEFFSLDAARILPSPAEPIPFVIGGKGQAAVRRAAAHGDGWLGIFCSARRFAQTRGEILEATRALGRPEPTWFGVNVWCGLDSNGETARGLIGERMEALYKLPYEKFQHVAPAGTPEHVAEWLTAFVDGGAEHITLIPVAASVEAGLEHAAKVRELLAG